MVKEEMLLQENNFDLDPKVTKMFLSSLYITWSMHLQSLQLLRLTV